MSAFGTNTELNTPIPNSYTKDSNPAENNPSTKHTTNTLSPMDINSNSSKKNMKKWAIQPQMPPNPYRTSSTYLNSLMTKNIGNNTSSPSSSVQKIKQILDKVIALTKGMVFNHIHIYLKMTIKKAKTEEDHEAMIKKPLQRFLEIMLQVDPHTVIPDWVSGMKNLVICIQVLS